MSQIITDLLSLERIEARFREAEQVHWHTIVEQAVTAVQVELHNRDHTLTVEYPPDLPAIWGDAIQLRQAMVNLLSNAIKYTPPGGQITFRVFRREYAGRLTVAVEVEDNGIGIPPEQQANLFQPFYRAQQRGTGNIPGEGLGLSVVKTAVEHHRGKVYFDSEPGEGSLFGFWVPV
jgi:signal transduction histidine kinase